MLQRSTAGRPSVFRRFVLIASGGLLQLARDPGGRDPGRACLPEMEIRTGGTGAGADRRRRQGRTAEGIPEGRTAGTAARIPKRPNDQRTGGRPAADIALFSVWAGNHFIPGRACFSSVSLPEPLQLLPRSFRPRWIPGRVSFLPADFRPRLLQIDGPGGPFQSSVFLPVLLFAADLPALQIFRPFQFLPLQIFRRTSGAVFLPEIFRRDPGAAGHKKPARIFARPAILANTTAKQSYKLL